MTTVPQPAPPTAPPAPPCPSRNVLPIVWLSLALIVVVSLVVVLAGLRFISHAVSGSVQVHVKAGESGRKEVSIRTPIGSFEVNKDVNEARLGLPIYPGAKRMKDDDSGAAINMSFGGEQGVRLVVVKLETPDSLEQVRNFYQERIGSEVTKFRDKDEDGKTVFEIKRKDMDKIVALKSVWGGTRIELVHVEHGGSETN